MKRTTLRIALPLLCALAALTASCTNSATEQQSADAQAAIAAPAPSDSVVSTIDFDQMEAQTLAGFKGGEGEVYMKMYAEGDTKIMLCTVPAGASVGYHAHENTLEVIRVMSGEATILLDSVQTTVYTPGQVHYCPMGHAHSIANCGTDDLVIYNVVAK